jgi:hypothetical protein
MQLNLDVHHELIIDNFAGGCGASTAKGQAREVSPAPTGYTSLP